MKNIRFAIVTCGCLKCASAFRMAMHSHFLRIFMGDKGVTTGRFASSSVASVWLKSVTMLQLHNFAGNQTVLVAPVQFLGKIVNSYSKSL